MNKIQEIIEAECYDWKPSDTVWELKKEDVPVIVENIKKSLISAIKDYAEHVDDVVSCIEGF
jgi:hypothetical protein